MQLVLLSGGSGSLLWPLSNNARSKQFLPLLEKEDGTMESMIQRVVRQAREADLSEDITIASDKSCLDIITNQLGDSVTAVAEPERRKTFPAAALAASYLKLEKGCTDDEIVVLMPCDPYTDTGYFETVKKMVETVDAGAADIVLMGIPPASPSEEFGYVKPAADNGTQGYRLVESFIEKPDRQLAKELIKIGAYWNGGVFAFRLGYLLEIVGRYLPVEGSIETIRSRYSELPKISFDCEVVEKAKSVAVVPFEGEWKDLGDWATLCGKIRKNTIGNAVMGPHCENTHVINELQNPIYVDGLKDIVVAACPDGILVCSKEHSGEIKNSVTNLTPRPMYEERRWGTYRVLDDSYYADGRHALTKTITLKPGRNISYQIHHHRSETWTFVEGKGIFVLDGTEIYVQAGETVVIPVEHWHAIKALTELTFIEVQSGNPLIEEDIERTTWEWSK
ncbi:MAG: cupin domain-containing protein [Bacteroidales bacterium]|nr:cupin domain-containing protein [Bacteroidales bacterium]